MPSENTSITNPIALAAMSKNLNSLTTPEEFITHYHDELKTKLNASNIKLSRVGFLGFFLELLGNVQFDVKQYYDSLLREAFPITADQTTNLSYHSNLYGHTIGLAKFSKIKGSVRFILGTLPIPISIVNTREIVLTNVNIATDSIPFVLLSDYKIIMKRSDQVNFTYVCEITNTQGKRKVIPFLVSNPSVEISELQQYEIDSTTFTSPKYVFGTHYSYTIEIPEDQHISDIKAFINGVEFKTQQTKDFVSGTDEVIFYQQSSVTTLLIRLGSGFRGRYIPSSTIRIDVYKTHGSKGNIGTQIIKGAKGKVHIFDYDANDELINQQVDLKVISQFLEFDVEAGEQGVDPLEGEDLRDDLIRFIQSRENLISETDFRDILPNYFKKFDVLFKKTHCVENNVYIYNLFNDRYFYPVHVVTTSMLEDDFLSTMIGNKAIYHPELTVNGETFISPFLYTRDDLLGIYRGIIVKKDPTFYFTNFTRQVTNDLSTPPAVYIEFEYTITDTIIKIKSAGDISAYTFILTVPLLEITNETMTPGPDDNTFEYVYGMGIIAEDVEMTVDTYFDLDGDTNDEFVYRFIFENVRQGIPITDVLMLRSHLRKTDGNRYIINLPVIKKDTFEEDELYYSNKIVSSLGNLVLSENRMISDDVQVRYLNTYYIPNNYVEKVTKQEYTHDITLPLVITLDLKIDRATIVRDDLNVDTIIEELRLTVAQFLSENKSGIDITFYRTEIVDLTHNQNWVKSLSVQVHDSNNQEIENGNIETIPQKEFVKLLTKEELLDFAPVYWYWAINNVNINYVLE